MRFVVSAISKAGEYTKDIMTLLNATYILSIKLSSSGEVSSLVVYFLTPSKVKMHYLGTFCYIISNWALNVEEWIVVLWKKLASPKEIVRLSFL